MFKISILLMLFASVISKAQQSTIWFYRSNTWVASWCGMQIKISNQKPFVLYNDQSAKFNLNYNGKVAITAMMTDGCVGTVTSEEWLVVEPGKEYFVELKNKSKNIINIIAQPKSVEKWTSEPKYFLEEDKKYPIKTNE
jgi:hypothetical protein